MPYTDYTTTWNNISAHSTGILLNTRNALTSLANSALLMMVGDGSLPYAYDM